LKRHCLPCLLRGNGVLLSGKVYKWFTQPNLSHKPDAARHLDVFTGLLNVCLTSKLEENLTISKFLNSAKNLWNKNKIAASVLKKERDCQIGFKDQIKSLK